MMLVVQLTVFVLFAGILQQAIGEEITFAGCTDLGVAVTVSSLITTAIPRQLQLSYWNAVPQPGDFVGLYNSEPGDISQPLAVLPVIGNSGQNKATGVEAPWIDSRDLVFTAQCLGYWAAYVRDEQQVLAMSCLGTQPTWMEDNRQQFGNMKIRDIFLPGTHDASAYQNYSDNVLNKYTYTQEEDILSQLVAGIRYVDMRVAYLANTDNLWWTVHGAILLHPLSEITKHVHDFLENTDEIVIFDIHSLTGFGDTMDIHNDFIAWLNEELGDHMASSSLTWDTTLNAIWTSGRKLIVTYNNNQVVFENNNLWPIVAHQWGDVQDVDALYRYLEGVANNPPQSGAWSAMAELTPSAADVITDRLGGLRQMADNVNYNVTEWYRGDWGETVNIVATDFFRGTNLVTEAVEWNLRRATGVSCRPGVSKT